MSAEMNIMIGQIYYSHYGHMAKVDAVCGDLVYYVDAQGIYYYESIDQFKEQYEV